jgi:Leucine-rich repeat (LRR) protein
MPARIDSIRSLQRINLARNRIRHINWLHKLMLLEELDLSSNRLSDIEAQLIVLVSNEVKSVSLSPQEPFQVVPFMGVLAPKRCRTLHFWGKKSAQ